MFIDSRNAWAARIALIVALLSWGGNPASAPAQAPPTQPVHFRVSAATQRLEMIVNTSRILTMEHDIPRMLVNNPNIVKATPLSPNQVQVSATQPGVTQLNLWDDKQKVYTIDVVVSGDARELQDLLSGMFPTAQLSVRPLAQSVVISGYVPSPDMMSRIVRVAEDYYPNVINNMKVAGVQTVLLHTKVYEVSRTKLRTLGVDWAHVSGGGFVVQSVSGLISAAGSQTGVATGLGGDTIRFGVIDGNTSFFGFIEALRQDNLAKVLAEPTLVTISGRPATFHSGGEFPILVPQSLGTVSVEYRQFGTRVDYVPIVLGNGRVRLEVRPMVSEVDPARSVTMNNITVPALRTRWVDTAVEMQSGQTLALAGLIQTRIESERKGLPWLSDLPWAGAAFRRVHEINNEIELLILVTPEFVDAMDPHEVPCVGPGQTTTTPNDVELYWRGYLEVPNCHDGLPAPHAMPYAPGPMHLPPIETIPQGRPNLPPALDAPLPPQAYRPTQFPPSSQTTQQNPSLRNSPANPRTQPAAGNQSGLIGPLGYDELK